MAKRQREQPPLFDVLNAIEVDAGVVACVDSLGDTGRKRLLEIATKKSKGKYSTSERARAVFLLGELRWRPAFASLGRLLRDESATVRFNSIYAIAAVGGPHAIQPLLATIKDPKAELSEKAHALHCLAVIGDQDTLKELESWGGDVADIELRRVVKMTQRRLRLVIERLDSPR